MKRDLSREAHLWYTITSPAYTDHAYAFLKEAWDMLLSCVSAYVGDYPPVPYWGGGGERPARSVPARPQDAGGG